MKKLVVGKCIRYLCFTFSLKYSIPYLLFWIALMANSKAILCRFACRENDLKGVYGLFSIG